MNCFNCGKEIPDNSNYCQICGALQEKKESCSDIGISIKIYEKVMVLTDSGDYSSMSWLCF